MSARPTSAADTPIDIAVTLDPVISITTDASDNTLNIPITPTATGTLGTTGLTVSIHTNNPTGYTLTMSSSTNDTSLTHATDSTHTIPTTTATLASPAILPTNTWGYSKWTSQQLTSNTTPTTFSNIPALSSPENVSATTDQTEDPDTKLTFAANASSTLASGTYINTIVFTATTNYVPEPGPAEPDPSSPTTYGAMQTMTNAECSTTRGTAFDARNGQTYYVQKIGNLCWMETNLRYQGYDGNGEQWNSAWGYGDDRYAIDAAAAAATDNPNDDVRPLTTISGTQVSHAETAQLVDAEGSTDYTNTAAAGGFYGYLYTWCAAMGGQATACQGSAATQPDQTQSICPAGWRLSTGGSGGEYGAMMYAMGAINNAAGSTILRNGFLAVYSAGYASGLYGQDEWGYVWSSTVSDAARAYGLFFDDTRAYPGTDAASKSTGFAVRCVLE